MCVIRGGYCGLHVTIETYMQISEPKSFNTREDQDHLKQTDEFALESLAIAMVGQFVLDYMHSVCICVMKRLLKRRKKSPTQNKGPTAPLFSLQKTC